MLGGPEKLYFYNKLFCPFVHRIYHVVFRFTNNVLSTAQQVWLRKLGGAKPVVSENASGIITAGRAKRSVSQTVQPGERSVLHEKMHVSSAFSNVVLLTKVAINRFRKLKEEEEKKTKALPTEDVQTLVSTSDSDDDQDEETKDKVKFDS